MARVLQDEFLHRTGPYADAPRPGLIRLDLNLPRGSGLEVLAELKARGLRPFYRRYSQGR